ncbi:MAG: winged helix-turn-helix domain-containing protein [Thermoleophilia bacterium]|nr:winged helix-turn-helix domain-containing protein [Thermoleophilia bacterium]
MPQARRCSTSAAAISATNVERLDPAEARAIIVSRQGFATRNRGATAESVLATIGRLGCVQLDSVMTVARAHRLTLAARVGRVPATTLNGLRRSGQIAEVWAHEACLIDANDLPYFRGGMLSETQHRWWGPVLNEHPQIAKEVLRRIEAEGPLMPGDFGGAGTPGWWEWSPAKQVFEALFSSGQLAVRERRGFARVYDLPERLYTAQQLVPVDDAAALRWRVLRAITARGIVTEARLPDYFRVPGRTKTLAVPVAELIEEGAIIRGQLGDYAALADPAALNGLIASSTDVLLCPFDNMVWDREETERLFGFRHRLELYVPKPKRQYGYYVLPLLVGSRIVGRADVKADRKAGTLVILAMHWEGRTAMQALSRAAARLAWTLGLPSVTFA